MSDEEKKMNNIPANVDGIYIDDVSLNSGAYAAGVRKGDVIRKINDATSSQVLICRSRLAVLNREIKSNVTYQRNGALNTLAVTLKIAQAILIL